MPITSAPPVKRTPAKPAPVKQDLTDKRAEAIAGLGQIAQGILIATHQYADAGAVGMYFPGIAAEVAKLASADEKIAKFIDPLLQVGPYTGLLTAVLPLAMQLMVNHGRGQAGVMGTVSPDFLESKTKTAVMQAAIEAKKEQQAVEAEFKRLEDQLAA